MHNANPINTAVRQISPQSLRDGIHVLELFAGIGLGVLRATPAAGFIIRCYTYVDKDPVSRHIACFVFLGLQREFPLELPASAILRFRCRCLRPLAS